MANISIQEKEIPQIGMLSHTTKRVLDIFGSVFGLVIFSPIYLVITIIIKQQSPGPVIFKQKRFGRDGKVFFIYKFRSMVVNAEQVLKENKELYEEYVRNNYKLEQDKDPRITKIGRFIRKTSLDELPQFINVLKGEMSLVGPRPVVPVELEEYGDKKDLFLSVKPGITGYWQVCGRSDVGYPERVDIELHYVHNQSIWLDIQILFKTVLHVLARKGAY